MKSFHVIWWDFNDPEPEPYDIMPYLMRCYKEKETKPKTWDEFREFVKKESMYMWWSRCQYEIIISDWPNQSKQKKWDIYMQIMMNIDLVVETLMENVNGNTAS